VHAAGVAAEDLRGLQVVGEHQREAEALLYMLPPHKEFGNFQWRVHEKCIL